MTLLGWLKLYAPQDILESVQSLLFIVNAATKEVIRLENVIREHTKKLSDPIVWNYETEGDIKIENSEKYFQTKVTIRLHPIAHTLTVPFAGEVEGWSEEFKRHFYDQTTQGFAHHAAKLIEKTLWPKEEDQK